MLTRPRRKQLRASSAHRRGLWFLLPAPISGQVEDYRGTRRGLVTRALVVVVQCLALGWLLAAPGPSVLAATAEQPVQITAAVASGWAALLLQSTVGCTLQGDGAAMALSAPSQLAEGATIDVPAAAFAEVVYYRTGRRERWQGPAKWVVRGEGGVSLKGSPEVTWLPESAMLALRRAVSGPQTISGRPGAYRVRAIPGSAQAMEPVSMPQDVSRTIADAASAAKPRPISADNYALCDTLPALQVSFAPSTGIASFLQGLEAVGYVQAKANGPAADVVVTVLEKERISIAHPFGTWVVDHKTALPVLQQVARVIQLSRWSHCYRGPTASLRIVVPNDTALQIVDKRIFGQTYGFEVGQSAGDVAALTLYELGPDGSVHTLPFASPEAIGPDDYRRLRQTYKAAPPVGHYLYLAILWPAAGGSPQVVRQVLQSNTPAASIRVSAAHFGIAVAPLLLTVAPNNQSTIPGP